MEEVQAVTADELGTPEVNEADYLSAVGLSDEVAEPPKEEKPKEEKPEKPPEEKPKEEVKKEEVPKETPKETNPPKRKIKWHGQEV